MIILDTDHLTLLEWGGPQAAAIDKRMAAFEPGAQPSATIISYEEHVRGWLARLSSVKTVDAQVRVYAKLARQREFYETIEVLDFSTLAAVEYQRLVSLKLRVGTMDLKIAAIALAHNATLFTRNLRDFSRIPNLRTQDATT